MPKPAGWWRGFWIAFFKAWLDGAARYDGRRRGDDPPVPPPADNEPPPQ